MGNATESLTLSATGECNSSSVEARSGDGSFVAFFVALIVLVAFAPATGNGFVNWDDQTNFLDNQDFRGIGPSQIGWAWRTLHLGVYQPVSWMLLGAEYTCFGLEPAGYHGVSLALYAINTVVLYALITTLLARCCPERYQRDPRSAHIAIGVAVAMFAVHPLRVEVVAWVSCQPYLPCALFMMLAVLTYLRACETSPASKTWLLVTWCLFAAALLSKAVATSLPAVLMLLDVYPLRRLGNGRGRWFGRAALRVWAEKVPFVVLSLIFSAIAVRAKAVDRTLIEIADAGVTPRVAQACYGTWFYLLKTVWPLDIVAYYPLPKPFNPFTTRFLVPAFSLIGLSVLLIRYRRSLPALLAAWIGYLIILGPNSGLIRIGSQIAADRYSYVPGMVLTSLAAAGLWRLIEPGHWKKIVLGVAAILIGILVFLTRDQCRTWATSQSLWTHCLQNGPSRNTAAHYGLATAYLFESSDLTEAERHFNAILEFNPTMVQARVNLGAIAQARGQFEKAEAEFLQAVRTNARSLPALHNLGWLSIRKGEPVQAEAWFSQAVLIDHEDSDAQYDLGIAYARQGRLAEARERFDTALRINPRNSEAKRALDDILYQIKLASRQ